MRTIYTFLLLLFVQPIIAKTSLNVTFTHDGLSVNARIQIPDGSGPHPVIIIGPGSGANDKDGTIPMVGGNVACLYPGLLNNTLTPYKDLSEALSDSGYAVLTYDKIEFTHPTTTISFYRIWMPIKSAIAYLKTRNDVDTNQIILIGHSESSGTIPYIARTEPGVKALISLAGPRGPIDSILPYQMVYIAQTCGGDVNMAIAQGQQIQQYCADVRNGNYTSSTPPMFGVSAAVWDDYFNVMDSVAINYNLAAKSTLFIGLGDDFNVPVATELTRFQAEVTIPADFYTIPGLNHYMTTATVPTVAEVVTDTIVHWLRGRIYPASVATLEGGGVFDISIQNDLITVNSAMVTIKSIHVTDMSGRLIRSNECMDFSCRIDMSDAAPAMYILNITTSAGRKAVKVFLQ